MVEKFVKRLYDISLIRRTYVVRVTSSLQEDP